MCVFHQSESPVEDLFIAQINRANRAEISRRCCCCCTATRSWSWSWQFVSVARSPPNPLFWPPPNSPVSSLFILSYFASSIWLFFSCSVNVQRRLIRRVSWDRFTRYFWGFESLKIRIISSKMRIIDKKYAFSEPCKRGKDVGSRWGDGPKPTSDRITIRILFIGLFGW